MLKKKKKTTLVVIIILLVVLAVASGGGYYYYKTVYIPAQIVEAESTLQTSKVRQGDMTISVTGTGNVVANQTYTLGFEIDGTIKDVYVEVGSVVKEGDLLAELVQEDSDQTLTSLQAALKNAQTNLLSAQMNLQNLIDNAAQAKANAQQALLTAEDDLAEVQKDRDYMNYARCSDSNIDSTYVAYLQAKEAYNRKALEFDEYTELSTEDPVRAAKQIELSSAYDTLQSAYSTWQYCFTTYNEEDKVEKDAEILVAQAAVDEAKALVERLGEDGLDDNEVALYEQKVESAELAVEKAQYAVDNYDTTDSSYLLYAPDDGTIISVNYSAGEVVGSQITVISMINMDNTVIDFYLDETDMASAKVGMPVNITFDSISDMVFTGTITKIYPELYSDFGSAYVEGLITIDPESMIGTKKIVVGMNATVEIISAESDNTLMVPIEALHKQDNGDYAVYIVNNGEATLTPVTVGLFDITYVEITSGLSAGQQVLTGSLETN